MLCQADCGYGRRHRVLAHQCDAGDGVDRAIRSAGEQSRDGKYFISSWSLILAFRAFWMPWAIRACIRPALYSGSPEPALAQDPKHWRPVCDWYRGNGFGLALANAGTGPGSSQTLLDLRPDYVKLEKTLVWTIEQLTSALAVRRLADLAEKWQLNILADGVERHRTVENLWLLGVRFMQGTLFGNPALDIVHSNSTDLANLALAVGTGAVAVLSR